MQNKFNISDEEKNKILEFTDIYMVLHKFNDSYLYFQDSFEPKKIPIEYRLLFNSFAKVVIQVCNESKGREDHLVLFENRYFRCSVINSIKGRIINARQMQNNKINLQKLNLNKITIRELMHKRLNDGGLILICGSPGQGKTTTSSATVIKRLEKWGGMCITIEDPPEIHLDGRHGCGVCIQTQVCKTGFANSIRKSMRSYPTGQNSIMFVGEVRDEKTAVEVLKASIDGRLVITTVHADSVLNSIQRVITLASGVIGDGAYDMMSNSFRVAIHQKLSRIDKKLKIKSTCLVNTTTCVNLIKDKKLSLLTNEAEKQKTAWDNNVKVEYNK